MGHHINAIIGRREALADLIDHLGSPAPTPLADDLIIVPLDEHRLDKISVADEPSYDGFTYLKPRLVDEIGRMVPRGRFLYLETDYFGGMGSQSAALFDSGDLRWKRSDSTFVNQGRKGLFATIGAKLWHNRRSPISEGLLKLGVTARMRKDEFDEVGLGRFRTLEALGLDEE